MYFFLYSYPTAVECINWVYNYLLNQSGIISLSIKHESATITLSRKNYPCKRRSLFTSAVRTGYTYWPTEAVGGLRK